MILALRQPLAQLPKTLCCFRARTLIPSSWAPCAETTECEFQTSPQLFSYMRINFIFEKMVALFSRVTLSPSEGNLLSTWVRELKDTPRLRLSFERFQC